MSATAYFTFHMFHLHYFTVFHTYFLGNELEWW